MADAESEVWEFRRDLESIDDVWTWRRKVGGLVDRQSEGPIVGFGKAMGDAMRNGFSASWHVWLVSDKEYSTYFAPGAEPRTVKREPPTIPPRRE